MVLFGGVTSGNVVQGGIYILDVATMTWTEGTSAMSSNWRRAMACAASDDFFVAWGGDNNGAVMTTTPIIYNVKLNQWTNDFRGSSKPSTGPGPSNGDGNGSGDGSHSGSPSNVAAIAGGIVATVVAIALAGLLVYRHRRRVRNIGDNKQNQDNLQVNIVQAGDYHYGGGARESDDTIISNRGIEPLALQPVSPFAIKHSLYRPKSDLHERDEDERTTNRHLSSASISPSTDVLEMLSPEIVSTAATWSTSVVGDDDKTSFSQLSSPEITRASVLPVYDSRSRVDTATALNSKPSSFSTPVYWATQEHRRQSRNPQAILDETLTYRRVEDDAKAKAFSAPILQHVQTLFAHPSPRVPGNPHGEPRESHSNPSFVPPQPLAATALPRAPTLPVSFLDSPPPPVIPPRPSYTPATPNTTLAEIESCLLYPSMDVRAEKRKSSPETAEVATRFSLAAMSLEHELAEEEADEVKIKRLALIQVQLDQEVAKLENRLRKSERKRLSSHG
ncbi:hypothetical protein BGZ83_009327 [Gryganskiella cystojenkinii]|nr:hypothetical protein BGZ83_009327 [Gryganskiella cystojenkinii]